MLPAQTIDEIIEGVFEGKYSVFNLPKVMYSFTAEALDGMFFGGFGNIPRGDLRAIEKAVNFRQNIGMFSGAKTFQNISELTQFVFTTDGKKRPFAEFKKKALEIDSKYNKNWLKTEQDSVFIQSQNARKWIKIENEAEIFPILQYQTVGDDRVRPSHKDLDGLKLRVNDPLWDRITPQNEWGCRCMLIQLEETRTTSKREAGKATEKIFEDFKKKATFDFNPGKTDFIFKEKGKGKHEYFKVPKQFKDDLNKNFGFPNIDEITGRKI